MRIGPGIVTILLTSSCATENQIIDSSTCDTPDGQATDSIVYVNQCPEVNLTCPDIPECPEVNVVCPDPEIIVEVVTPEPQVDINVEAPNVTVTNDVEAPDFGDLVDAILQSSSGGLNRDYFAHSIYINPYSNPSRTLWENTSSSDAVVTMIASYEDNLDCDLLDASGNIIVDKVCHGGSCQRGGVTHGRGSGPGWDNRLTLPVQPGEYIQCYSGDSCSVYVQGYYQ